MGDERVQAQASDFYGGWITADLVGPFRTTGKGLLEGATAADLPTRGCGRARTRVSATSLSRIAHDLRNARRQPRRPLVVQGERGGQRSHARSLGGHFGGGRERPPGEQPGPRTLGQLGVRARAGEQHGPRGGHSGDLGCGGW